VTSLETGRGNRRNGRYDEIFRFTSVGIRDWR
jgi:hypothetical protein